LKVRCILKLGRFFFYIITLCCTNKHGFVVWTLVYPIRSHPWNQLFGLLFKRSILFKPRLFYAVSSGFATKADEGGVIKILLKYVFYQIFYPQGYSDMIRCRYCSQHFIKFPWHWIDTKTETNSPFFYPLLIPADI